MSDTNIAIKTKRFFQGLYWIMKYTIKVLVYGIFKRKGKQHD